MSRLQLLWFGSAICIGLLLPVQAAMNARLRTLLGSPLRAGLVNFLVGALALACVVLLVQGASAERPQRAWWAWFGGLLGALQVLGTIVLTPRLGATALVAGVMAGQFAAALLIDHWGALGYATLPISWMRGVGVLLMLAGGGLVLSR